MLRRSIVPMIATALLAVACSPETSTPTAEVTEQSDSSEVERPSKAELLAQFNDTMARAAETHGPGKPVLWTLSDEDTAIHMFGTVHLLRPDMDWRSDAFNTAFSAADTLVFEVDLKSPEGQRALMEDFLTRGFYQDGQTLRGALDDQIEPIIEAAFDSIGVPLDAVNAMEPWMGAVNLGVLKLQADGFDPESGVESVLEIEAQAAGKAFGYLESASDQADAFDLLPEDVQIEFLYETALLLDESPQMLDQLVDEWADGDVIGLGAIAADPSAAGVGGAEVYNSLLRNRNRNWVPQIEAMLDTPGTVFIAVGAAHLAGPDSVITMLRDNGHAVSGP